MVSIKNNFNNKKGFGSVASTLIMFIAIIGVSLGMVISLNNYLSSTQDAMKVQNDATTNKLKAIISITNIFYNSSSNKTYTYVKNIGVIKLYSKNLDVFIDNKFESNFSVFYANNLSKNLNLLEPQETMVIINNKYLPSGTHTIKVVTGYSSYTEDSFNN